MQEDRYRSRGRPLVSGRSVINGQLHRTFRLLQSYSMALEDAKSRGGTTEQRDEVQSFLDVLVPMSLHLRGVSYFDHGIDWEKMFEMLRHRHREDWPAARDGIITLASRLEESDGPRVALSGEDMAILDGVEGVLDSECSYLHRKTRGR